MKKPIVREYIAEDIKKFADRVLKKALILACAPSALLLILSSISGDKCTIMKEVIFIVIFSILVVSFAWEAIILYKCRGVLKSEKK